MKKQGSKLQYLFYGAICGVVNGLFGGGGGMIVVPILTGLLNKPTKVAHATAILIILPVSVASAILYLFYGHFSFQLFIPVTIGVFLGGIIGSFLLKNLKNGYITIIFAFVMLIAGIKMAV